MTLFAIYKKTRWEAYSQPIKGVQAIFRHKTRGKWGIVASISTYLFVLLFFHHLYYCFWWCDLISTYCLFSFYYLLLTFEPWILCVIWQIHHSIYSCVSLFMSPRPLNTSLFFKQLTNSFWELSQWQQPWIDNSRMFICFLAFVKKNTKSLFK